MANITPNTNIYLCTGVPIDNNYRHSLFFASRTVQHTYFQSKVSHTFLANTYQRVGRNKIRLGVLADNILTCNYLMFQNTAFGTKWFYAFINDVEYINNSTTEITYELDVLQTWLADFQLKACMVLREHSASDTPGDNIIPEPVSCGEYVFNSYDKMWGDAQYVIIAINRLGDGQTVDGRYYCGTYGAAKLYAYDIRDFAAINGLLETYISSPDSVLSMYMAPSALVAGLGFVDSPVSHNYPGGRLREGMVSPVETGATAIPSNATCGGYTPKNKKLFTYPYTYFSVINPQGESLNTRYEFFQNGTPLFRFGGCVTQPVELVCYPANYKGSGSGSERANASEHVALRGFPACSWNSDYYSAWVAQTAVPGILNAGSNIGAALAGGTLSAGPMGGVAAAGLTAMKEAATAVSAHYSASIHADITKGSLNSGSAPIGMSMMAFYGGRVSVNAQSAREIDDFFSLYGYAVNARKVPTITNRPHWNYIRTSGCIIEGNIPSDDEHKIVSIFDEGITWWKNPSEVGAYWLDNSPA